MRDRLLKFNFILFCIRVWKFILNDKNITFDVWQQCSNPCAQTHLGQMKVVSLLGSLQSFSDVNVFRSSIRRKNVVKVLDKVEL